MCKESSQKQLQLSLNYWSVTQTREIWSKLKRLASFLSFSCDSVLQAWVCALLSPTNCDATRKPPLDNTHGRCSLCPWLPPSGSGFISSQWRWFLHLSLPVFGRSLLSRSLMASPLTQELKIPLCFKFSQLFCSCVQRTAVIMGDHHWALIVFNAKTFEVLQTSVAGVLGTILCCPLYRLS